jgi:acetyl-CoA carboxylase biotin carboxylase subunit
VLGDGQGDGVHLGERDCSLQRRHQKVLEEAPSPALNTEQRNRIGELAAAAVRKLKYRGAGTMEFLFQDGEFYFIEMNTRLQVEHPITEAVTGIDLVREQIRIAAGGPLALRQEDIVIHGHAIECRINAENPRTFVPSPGKVVEYHPPGGLGVRVDSGLFGGYSIPPFYDSMVAKLIVSGPSRNECLMRLRRSLEEFVIGGIETTIPLHQEIIQQQEFIDGDYNIHWLEKLVGLKK